MLIIFGGLPGVGKTTIAKALAKLMHAVYLRVDTVEQVLKREAKLEGPEGYMVCDCMLVCTFSCSCWEAS